MLFFFFFFISTLCYGVLLSAGIQYQTDKDHSSKYDNYITLGELALLWVCMEISALFILFGIHSIVPPITAILH